MFKKRWTIGYACAWIIAHLWMEPIHANTTQNVVKSHDIQRTFAIHMADIPQECHIHIDEAQLNISSDDIPKYASSSTQKNAGVSNVHFSPQCFTTKQGSVFNLTVKRYQEMVKNGHQARQASQTLLPDDGVDDLIVRVGFIKATNKEEAQKICLNPENFAEHLTLIRIQEGLRVNGRVWDIPTWTLSSPQQIFFCTLSSSAYDTHIEAGQYLGFADVKKDFYF